MRTLHRHPGDVANSGTRGPEASLDSPSPGTQIPPLFVRLVFSFMLKSYDHFVKTTEIVVTNL